MKRVIIILLFCLEINFLYGQDFYMYVNGQKRTYEISTTKFLVKSEMSDNTWMRIAVQKTIADSVKNIYYLNNNLMMIDIQNTSKENLMELQKQWNTKEDITYISPVLLDGTGNEIGGFTNQVLIRLNYATDYPILTKAAMNYHVKTIKSCDFDEQTYSLTLDKGSEKNAMQTANELYETGMFDYAEPNLIHFLQLSTNDQYFTQQWALNNTGQSGGVAGIDIKALQTWSITTGSPNIQVAILDVGVELNHPDLVNNLLPGYDATGNNSNGAPINNTGDNAHGTACAGIVAAQANNTIGIAGIAYNCRIIPVRIAAKSAGWTITESQYIANGINWARQNGRADVISMSFGCTETTALNTEMSNAVTSGRNNYGCVLVASSGNSNSTTIRYPARLNNVIAVGAINNQGNRASFSNYGDSLDVVAPGVGIYTTDIQGSAGYNTASGEAGNYYSGFDGTSAACPYAAGVAALVLSVRPDFTQMQVRQAIESTCTKLSGYSFSNNSGHPNGTWNNQVGHGLVNAYAAVNKVAPAISGPSNICKNQSATFILVNKPPGASVSWSCSVGKVTLTGVSGDNASFQYASTGADTIIATVTINNIPVVVKKPIRSGKSSINTI